MIPHVRRESEPSLQDSNPDICRPLNTHVLVWIFETEPFIPGAKVTHIGLTSPNNEAPEQTLVLTMSNTEIYNLKVRMEIAYAANAVRHPNPPPLQFRVVSCSPHQDPEGVLLKISSKNRSNDFQTKKGNAGLVSAFYFSFTLEKCDDLHLEVQQRFTRYSSLVRIVSKTKYNNEINKDGLPPAQICCMPSPEPKKKKQKVAAPRTDDVAQLTQQFDKTSFLEPEDVLRPVAHCFRFAIGEGPCRTDIRRASNPVEFTLADMLGDGLFRVDCASTVQPSMCTSMECGPYQGMNAIIFTIRNDAKWSDGSPVTATDFVESWKNVLKYHQQLGVELVSHFFFIHNAKDYAEGRIPEDRLGIQLVNATQFYIVTARAMSVLSVQSIVARPPFLPVHATFRNDRPYTLHGFEASAHERRPFIGCGPFCIDEQRSDRTTIVLRRNDYFWNCSNVHFARIEMKRWNESMEYLKYYEGALDLYGSPACEFVSGRGTMRGCKYQPLDAIYMLIFDTRHPVWRHELLRQTVAHSIDREQIIAKLQTDKQHQFDGFEAAKGLVPRVSAYMAEQVPPTILAHDTTTALQRFADFVREDYIRNQGREPTKSEINFTYIAKVTAENFRLSTVNQAVDRAVASAIIEQLYTKVKFVPWDTDIKELTALVAQYRSQHYQVCRRLWFADYYDPATFLSLFKDGLDRTNNSYWENHEYKEIVEQIEHFSAMDDRARVAQLIERAERIILQAAPVIPLFHAKKVYYLKPYITNVAYTRLNFLSVVYGTTNRASSA